VYFFNAARTMGPHILCDWADRFGFGQPTGIDLPAEQSGRLPRPPDPSPATLANKRSEANTTVKPISRARPTSSQTDLDEPLSPWNDGSTDSGEAMGSNKRNPWYPGDTLGLAIGQSRLTTTPVQIVRMMAAIANDGWLVTPHVAHEISPPPEVDSATDHDSTRRLGLCPDRIEPPRQHIAGLTDGTLARVREGLKQVVAHPQGTGFKTVRLKEVAIAGKTGTAEIGRDRTGAIRPDHAWFAGYVPADNPQIAFVVVLEQAGSGGKAAGPVAQRFVQSLLELGLLKSGSR
jgi:penicillin-binding protein 2